MSSTNSFPQGIRLQAKGAQSGDLSVDKMVFQEFLLGEITMSNGTSGLVLAQAGLDGLRIAPVNEENKVLYLPTGSQIIEATQLAVGESKEYHIHLNGDLGDDGLGGIYTLSLQRSLGDATMLTDDGNVVRVMDSYNKTTLVFLRESLTTVRVM